MRGTELAMLLSGATLAKLWARMSLWEVTLGTLQLRGPHVLVGEVPGLVCGLAPARGPAASFSHGYLVGRCPWQWDRS